MPGGQPAEGQMQMFAAQPAHQPMQQTSPQPLYQPVPQPAPMSASQPLPQPRMVQPQPGPQAYQSEIPQSQPIYGGYYQNPTINIPVQPMEQQPVGQPQMYIPQPPEQSWQPHQCQQPQAMPQQPLMPVMQPAPGNTGREYHSQPQPAGTFCFDKDDESDRELLREDPYAEYPDFPKEYRLKDEAQTELVCC